MDNSGKAKVRQSLFVLEAYQGLLSAYWITGQCGANFKMDSKSGGRLSPVTCDCVYYLFTIIIEIHAKKEKTTILKCTR